MVSKKERIAFIDVLKGVAIICVVLGHIVDGYYKSNLYSNQNHIFWMIFVIIYAFHMGLFFILSGYLYGIVYAKLTISQKQNKIKNQIKKLLYVYIVWCFFMWAFKLVLGKWANGDVRSIDIVLIPVKSIDPYWYLYVLIIFYLFFSTRFIEKVRMKKVFIIVSIISIIASWMPIIRIFEISKVLYFAFFFYFGNYIAQNKVIFNKNILIMAILAIILIILKFPSQIDRIGGINWLCAIGISITLFWIFQSNEKICKKCKILQICGRYSLEIYVMHCFLTAFFRVLFYRLGLNNVFYNITLNLILSTILPLLCALCMKKLNIYDVFFNGIKIQEKFKKK